MTSSISNFVFKKLKLKLVTIFVLFTLMVGHFYQITVFAEPDCNNPGTGDIDYCLERIQKEIDALKPAHEYNKKELSDLRTQVSSLEKRIAAVSNQIKEKGLEIEKREEDLAYAKVVFNEKSESYYRFYRFYDPLYPFFASNDASTAFREIAFRQRAANKNIETMEKYAEDLSNLKSDKEKLDKNKVSLDSAKKSVSDRVNFLAKEVEKTESYLATLSGKQEELIAQKAGGFATSVGETPATLEPCSGPPGSPNFCSPGFSPAFAAFSFGAPHRAGMSQYGAYGRSKSGQNAETILSAYYQGAELNKSYPVPGTITVQGIGTVSFEDNYLLGIYEVPESWGDNGGFEALKAQAVAARSYALYYTGNGARSICTTEACQVYKPQLKSGKWAEAVRATRGWVLTKGGSAAGTYYASTSGGYTISQWGWSGIKDAPGNWPDTAYEKVSGSPWFYKAWYKSRGGATCGKNSPWLTSTEMADILNARYVLDGKGGDVSRISPVDTNCWGGNPYSVTELASVGGYNSVSGVSVVYGNDGSTQSVTFSTNKDSVTIKGSAFKEAFNLRAPGHIGLKSSLYNIVKL